MFRNKAELLNSTCLAMVTFCSFRMFTRKHEYNASLTPSFDGTCSLVCSLTLSLACLFTCFCSLICFCLLIRSCSLVFVRLLMCTFTCLFTHTFPPSFTCSFARSLSCFPYFGQVALQSIPSSLDVRQVLLPVCYTTPSQCITHTGQFLFSTPPSFCVAEGETRELLRKHENIQTNISPG